MRATTVVTEVGNGLRRNLGLTVAVVLVVLVASIMGGIAFLLHEQVNVMKDYWYDKVEVSVYLCGTDSVAASCNGQAVTDAEQYADPGRPAEPAAGAERLLRVQGRGVRALRAAVQGQRDRAERTPGLAAGVVPGQAQGPQAVRRRCRRLHRAARGRGGPGRAGTARQAVLRAQRAARRSAWSSRS